MKQELDDMQKTHCSCADKKETEFLAGGQLEPVLNSLSCCSLCMGAAAVVSSLPVRTPLSLVVCRSKG